VNLSAQAQALHLRVYTQVQRQHPRSRALAQRPVLWPALGRGSRRQSQPSAEHRLLRGQIASPVSHAKRKRRGSLRASFFLPKPGRLSRFKAQACHPLWPAACR
jgi:hypothetical protein